MYLYTDPKTGHVRRLASGRDCKRWLKEQQAKYVPTLAEDCAAMDTPTVGIGHTRERQKGSTGTKRFAGVPSGADIYGKVTHYSEPITLVSEVNGERKVMRIPSKPVISQKVRFKFYG